jgi:cell division cycle 14
MGSFMLINLGYRVEEIAAKFAPVLNKLPAFRDSGVRENSFGLIVIDVLRGLELALHKRWYNWRHFDIEEYKYFSLLEEGDFNWVLPNKILAFSSPTTYDTDGGLSPSHYLPYFKKNRVATVVRLNSKMYSHSEFEDHGIKVYDLEYPDGTNPCDEIVIQFIRLVDREISQGKAVAVHCRAGLGRTGTLIGLYIMYKYGADVRSTISWLRLTRPGSVVGEQ